MELHHIDIPEDATWKNKHWLAPEAPFRLLICGPSGSGKTNLLVDLVMHHIHFDKVYLYGRHLDQPKMRYLRTFFNTVRDVMVEESGGAITAEDADLLHEGRGVGDIIPLDDLPDEGQKLVIFDDLVMERDQSIIADYFVRARHKKCCLIYLSQAFYKTPRVIRLNCSHVVLYEIASGSEASMLCRELGLGITAKEFEAMYMEAVAEKYDFMVIDRATKNPLLKFRRKFDGVWWPRDYPPPPIAGHE